MKGKVTNTGYRNNSPDRDNDFNIIPSGNISMHNVSHPVHGMDNLGNYMTMMPHMQYQFPGTHVLEIPMKNKKQMGGQSDLGGGLSPEEARLVLQQGHVAGVGLTDAQRTRFAEIAGTDEEGNFLDENGDPIYDDEQTDNTSEEEFRFGGQRKAKKHGYTSKNIKSSINELFMKNQTVFGPHGKHIYSPNVKKEGGDMNHKIVPMPPHVFYSHGHAMNPWSWQYGGSPDNLSFQQVYDPLNKPAGSVNNFVAPGDMDPTIMNAFMQMGGQLMFDTDGDNDFMKKGGNWIQKAVNPAHKGYCTPMTKSTCTPQRKAFAMTMKKHHGFHQEGGEEMGTFENDFDNPFFQIGGQPQFKNEQEFHAWNKQQGNQLIPGEKKLYYNPKQFQYTPDTSRESGYKINSLDPNINLGAFNAIPSQYTMSYQAPTMQQSPPKMQMPGVMATSNKTWLDSQNKGTPNEYHTYRDTASGQTFYTDKSGQKVTFDSSGKMMPVVQPGQQTVAQLNPQKHGGEPCYDCGGPHMNEGGGISGGVYGYGIFPSFESGGDFLKAIVKNAYKDVTKKKKGGENAAQTTESYLQNRNNTFRDYLANNTMFHLANEEADNLMAIHKHAMMNYGGGYMQMGGGFQPADSLDQAQEFAGYVNPTTTSNQLFDNPAPSFANDLSVDAGTNGPVTPMLPGDPNQVSPQMSVANFMMQDVQKANFNKGPQQTQQKGPGNFSQFMQNNGVPIAEGLIAGMNFGAAALNAKDTRARENLYKQRMDADNQFSVDTRQNRGDYETNSGAFRPNQMVPNRKKGGESSDADGSYLTESEIKRLKSLGYKIEYLD
jgi:hypothetical protein